MKRKDLNNLILEAYTEVLAELNEAPNNVHYIKVESTELMEALGLLEEAFADSSIKFELNDPDTIYIHGADNADMHDAVEELQQNGIIVDETSIDDELEEESKPEQLLESLLDEVEEEDPTPEEDPDSKAGEETVLEDATDTILAKFPTVKQALIKLQTEDFKEFVESIDWISPRPTSFRVNLKNGQDYILKWTGKTFEAQILGKRYLLSNIADYQQAIDKLAILYRESPMKGAGEEGGEFDADTGGGGGGGDFPGGEEGGGGDLEGELGDELGGGEGDEGGEDLTNEPIDFEDGAEPEA
jgi:hypothetical protein